MVAGLSLAFIYWLARSVNLDIASAERPGRGIVAVAQEDPVRVACAQTIGIRHLDSEVE